MKIYVHFHQLCLLRQTIHHDGLFGAGDTVGGSAHKFSSGSFTEGRLAAKAAVKYIEDKKADGISVSDKQCEDFKTKVYKPLEVYKP